MFPHWDVPVPEDFGLSARDGGVSVVVCERHRPSQHIRTDVWVADGAPAHKSDVSVVMELRDPAGEVVAQACD